MGALNYNMKKMNHPDAELRAEILAGNFSSLNIRQINAEVEALRQLRPNLNRYVYHTSLNFPEKELPALTNEKLKAIAEDYLQAMGYTNNQYLIFRHHDASHPHLHLLVNRISFDGSVVSDSNNYKKSEAILRKLEYQYNLIPVEQSSFRAVEKSNGVSIEKSNGISVERGNTVSVERNNSVSQRAPKKNEIEMALRTGKPSDKMVLQAKLNQIIRKDNLSITDLINQGERQGIHFLFNQASTGRVTGITYFHNDFKIKGQALGNRFKWAELIKNINYEQTRDSEAISRANGRTRERYGLSQYPSADERNDGGGNYAATALPDAGKLDEFGQNHAEHHEDAGRDITADESNGDNSSKAGSGLETDTEHTAVVSDSAADLHDISIQISDDQDDALKRRKRRGR